MYRTPDPDFFLELGSDRTRIRIIFFISRSGRNRIQIFFFKLESGRIRISDKNGNIRPDPDPDSESGTSLVITYKVLCGCLSIELYIKRVKFSLDLRYRKIIEVILLKKKYLLYYIFLKPNKKEEVMSYDRLKNKLLPIFGHCFTF